MDEFETNEEFDSEGLFSYEELENICINHIKNSDEEYTEDQANKIIQWIEETRMNETLLKLVLEGKLDVVFDPDKLAECGSDENGLLFTMTKWTKDNTEGDLIEMFNLEDPDTRPGFFDLEFGDLDDDATKH